MARDDSGPISVGSKSPQGDGKWGHADLAGNLWEWTFDYWQTPYQNPCIDCANGGCSTGAGPRAYYTFREMDSHDIKLGMRWMLQPDQQQPVYQPPLMRKG